MKKTLLVSIIAVVLIAAIAGSCFALYKIEATNKVVNITASADVCNLTLNGSASFNFSNISPNNDTHTVDVTLDTDDSTLVDGVHGIFKVALSGDLASHIDVAVNEIDQVGNGATLGAANTDALTNAGADIALTAVPKYFRVTLTLKAASAANFAEVAELTGTVTVSWHYDPASIFAYDAEKYYIVGTVNGKTHWYPSADSITCGAGDTDNYAIATNVALKNGDVIKAVQGYKSASPAWFGGKTNNTVNVHVASDNANVEITADGYYDIYVGKDNRIWVAVHGS